MAEKGIVKDTQINFRITSEQKEEFKNICSGVGTKQADAFDEMFEAWKKDLGKETLANRIIEIETFEKLCKDMLKAYTRSLEVYENVEGRTRERYAKSLERKDKIIENLQGDIDKLKAGLKEVIILDLQPTQAAV